MEWYDINTDFMSIIAGTSNTMAKSYLEAAAAVEKPDKTAKYFENFARSIQNIADKPGAIDSKISASKGNLKSMACYDNMETIFKFLRANKSASGAQMVKDLDTIRSYLLDNEAIYQSGYTNNVGIIKLEYESLVYLLTAGLNMCVTYNFEVVCNADSIKMVPRPKAFFGVTGKTIHNMALEIKKKDHKDYLENIIYAVQHNNDAETELKAEGVEFEFTEGTVVDCLKLAGNIISGTMKVAKIVGGGLKSLKKSLFGILPLIRSVVYLSYKRKADHIISLEQQAAFIEQNIEQLKIMKTIDPEKKKVIIAKQRATAEAYKKKAEKIRAQLMEGEKDAATLISKEDPNMGNSDDDYVLENVLETEVVDNGTE